MGEKSGLRYTGLMKLSENIALCRTWEVGQKGDDVLVIELHPEDFLIVPTHVFRGKASAEAIGYCVTEFENVLSSRLNLPVDIFPETRHVPSPVSDEGQKFRFDFWIPVFQFYGYSYPDRKAGLEVIAVGKELDPRNGDFLKFTARKEKRSATSHTVHISGKGNRIRLRSLSVVIDDNWKKQEEDCIKETTACFTLNDSTNYPFASLSLGYFNFFKQAPDTVSMVRFVILQRAFLPETVEVSMKGDTVDWQGDFYDPVFGKNMTIHSQAFVHKEKWASMNIMSDTATYDKNKQYFDSVFDTLQLE